MAFRFVLLAHGPIVGVLLWTVVQPFEPDEGYVIALGLKAVATLMAVLLVLGVVVWRIGRIDVLLIVTDMLIAGGAVLIILGAISTIASVLALAVLALAIGGAVLAYRYL